MRWTIYYEIFEELCKRKGIKPIDVSRATGISTATLSSWKKGKYTPKSDKLQLIADFFEVPLETFTGKANSTFHRENKAQFSSKVAEEISSIVQEQVQSAYYDGYEAGKLAQKTFDDPNLRILLDAASDLSPDALTALIAIAKQMRKTNEDG